MDLMVNLLKVQAMNFKIISGYVKKQKFAKKNTIGLTCTK